MNPTVLGRLASQREAVTTKALPCHEGMQQLFPAPAGAGMLMAVTTTRAVCSALIRAPTLEAGSVCLFPSPRSLALG